MLGHTLNGSTTPCHLAHSTTAIISHSHPQIWLLRRPLDWDPTDSWCPSISGNTLKCPFFLFKEKWIWRSVMSTLRIGDVELFPWCSWPNEQLAAFWVQHWGTFCPRCFRGVCCISPPAQMEGFLARLKAPKWAPTPLLLTADSGLLREEAKRLLGAEFHLDEAHCKTDFLY